MDGSRAGRGTTGPLLPLEGECEVDDRAVPALRSSIGARDLLAQDASIAVAKATVKIRAALFKGVYETENICMLLFLHSLRLSVASVAKNTNGGIEVVYSVFLYR